MEAKSISETKTFIRNFVGGVLAAINSKRHRFSFFHLSIPSTSKLYHFPNEFADVCCRYFAGYPFSSRRPLLAKQGAFLIWMLRNTVLHLAIRRFLNDGDVICLVDLYQLSLFKCP